MQFTKTEKIWTQLWLVLFIGFFSCQRQPTDAVIEKAVREKIAGEPGYKAVHALVRSRIVFLTGQCVGEGCAQQLETSIREIDGVTAVENDITEGSRPEVVPQR